MSLPELLFCARNYKGGENGEIRVSTLRVLDALACPEQISLTKIAVGEWTTANADLANTFSDAVTHLKALGKSPEAPYTLQDIATLAARKTRPVPMQRAAYGDVLVLLHTHKAIDADLTAQARCVCDCSTESPLHAVLRLCKGAVLELARLPEQMQDMLALTECSKAFLLALPQQAFPSLLQAAKQQDIHACLFGVVTDTNTLELRHHKQPLLALDTAYLRSICFVRAYRVRADQVAAYRNAQQRAACAYAQAVTQGCDPAQIILQAQLRARRQQPVAQSAAELLCMMLGLYRFSAEAKVPVQIDATIDAADTDMTLKPCMPEHAIPKSTLQGQGRIYLLAPQAKEDGTPDPEQLRALTEALRGAMQEGKIKAVKLICNTTPKAMLEHESCNVTYNPHMAQTLVQPFPCAILAETDFDLPGKLIAVSTLPKQQNSMDNSDNIQ